MVKNKKEGGKSLRYRIQVIDRAVGILSCFSFEKPLLGVSEIAEKTGLHTSTVHRILNSLQSNRLIERDPNTEKYFLGVRLFSLGGVAVGHLGSWETARPHLEELTRQTGETTHLAVLDEGEVLYLRKVEGNHILQVPSRVGKHIPAHCTALGKTILAYLPGDGWEKVIEAKGLRRFTPNTIVEKERFREEMLKIRRKGYAEDREEIEMGLRCVAAPIFDYSGLVVAAISVAGSSIRLDGVRVRKTAVLVMNAAQNISKGLGYSPREARGGRRGAASG